MKVVIVAFEAFTDIDVFLPWDLLNRAAMIDKTWSVKIVGNKATHRSVCGIELLKTRNTLNNSSSTHRASLSVQCVQAH